MRKTPLIILFLLISTTIFSQDIANTATGKRYSHQVGVQVNELFRQILNFSNSTNTANTNPYLLVYSINSVKSGWGLRAGFGYNYQSFTNDDGITRKETNLNDYQVRLGVEKLFHLSPKWIAGIGIDGVMNGNDDYTKSTVKSFDTTTTITTTKIKSYGGGGMAWLRYHITPRVLIGTETSFYYTTGKENDEIAITQRKFNGGSNQLETTFSTVDNNRKEGRFSVPVAFYLIVKF